MTSRELYRRFTNLCQKWPKDESKSGRDYGEFFRDQLAKHFPNGEHGQIVDPEAAETSLKSLERLANNVYYNENPLKRSSASGLEAWACNEIISNEGIKRLQDDDESSILYRLRKSMSMKFLTTKSDYRVGEELCGEDGNKSRNETSSDK